MADGSFTDCPGTQNVTSHISMATTVFPVAEGKDLLLLRIIFVLIGVIGTLGNSLVIVVISSVIRKHASTFNFLIFNQAFVDMCTSVHLIFQYGFQGSNVPSDGLLGELLCRLWFSNTLLWMLFVVSTYNLVMLSLERFIAVIFPVYYSRRMKRRSALYMILFCWLGAPFLHSYYPIFFDYNDGGECKRHIEYRSAFVMGFVVIVWEFFVPFIAMSGMYTCIMVVLRHQQRRIHGSETVTQDRPPTGRSDPPDTQRKMTHLAVPTRPIALASNGSTQRNRAQHLPEVSFISTNALASSSTFQQPRPNQNTTSQRLRRNLTFTLLAVFVMFGFCWLPNHMTFLLFSIGKAKLGTPWHSFTLMLAYINMSINPFIYAWKYKKFQQGFKAIFCRNGRCGGDGVAHRVSRSSATPNIQERNCGQFGSL